MVSAALDGGLLREDLSGQGEILIRCIVKTKDLNTLWELMIERNEGRETNLVTGYHLSKRWQELELKHLVHENQWKSRLLRILA